MGGFGISIDLGHHCLGHRVVTTRPPSPQAHPVSESGVGEGEQKYGQKGCGGTSVISSLTFIPIGRHDSSSRPDGCPNELVMR